MPDLTRRSLLKYSILGTAAGTVAGGLSREARATGWGEIPAGIWPANYQPKKIFEIFCYGGMSPWENFWVSEDAPGGTKNWREFEADVQALQWHCAPESASPSDQTTFFGSDQTGTRVHWGPATKPLWRPDIFSRARMVTIAHDLEPHQAATPLALTGHRLGRARLAGKGAAIQHRQISLKPRVLPYAYVLAPDDMGFFEFAPSVAVATGMHPGYATPLLIRIGDNSFQTLLQRSQMTAEADQLFRVYQAMYRDHLRFQGIGEAIRSAGFTSYDTAATFLLNAAQLDTLLGGDVLAAHSDGRICGTEAVNEPPQVLNKTKTALEVATLLLTIGGARYVCVMDRGVRVANSNNSPYDTHDQPHVEVTSSNIFNLCQQLAAQIEEPILTHPGVIHPLPTKLDLDDTLIVIHSEFGRTPTHQDGPTTGRNHFPYGYVAVLIGGPIPSRLVTDPRRIQGHLDGDSGMVTPGNDYTPTDVHAAVLLAAGIDPFASENFGVADFEIPNVSDGSEQGTRINLRSKILGV